MTFQMLASLGICAWLASLACCYLSFRLSRADRGSRRLLALGLSLTSIVIGWLGWSYARITASKTVNGVSQWRFDSGWLYTLSILLGAATLVLAVWRWRRRAAV